MRKIRFGQEEYKAFFAALDNALQRKQHFLDFKDLLKFGNVSPIIANLTVFMFADLCIDDVYAVRNINGIYVAELKEGAF